MPRRIAVLGGGIAGLAAAYELNRMQQSGAEIEWTLIEASGRLGGILQTERITTDAGEFIVENGPDGWVTEKPWARELAVELGLEAELIHSNDAARVTYVLRGGRLLPLPAGMRMMVPSSLDALEASPLISMEAHAAYAAEPGRAGELKRTAPAQDESVAAFVERHFGAEVLHTIGAPLLGGIFGGDVRALSVRAVMKPFVDMEREHGSLILAAQRRDAERGSRPKLPIFTSLRRGTGTLAEAMAATLPVAADDGAPTGVHLTRRVESIQRVGDTWQVATVSTRRGGGARPIDFVADAVLLALPVTQARMLLGALDPDAAPLLAMQTSSADVVSFGFLPQQEVCWPAGFGFLVADGEPSPLLAGTFADQKWPRRVPPGCRLVRAYYGGLDVDADGEPLPPDRSRPMRSGGARADLESVLGPLPPPAFTVRHSWPRALPQYAVGHVERMAELDRRIHALGTLRLLGNGYRGVGLPELIRDGRAAAREIAAS